eukprot:CAMPEP_0195307044 /NCGR_PEP_ID=MMETSP0707-20130614/37516_1 /TAXON_ID=33640 /ORGANISM="Asterionellopsis glacialis, Strain CCMP134" /LENGTH=371 /DNA_ID=CAMNT_0040371285 /DNA_START=1011 /DNA_END=2126 /DNA_ORIENTATION=-
MTSDRTISKEIIVERNSYRSMESDLSETPSEVPPPPKIQPNIPKPTHKRGTSSVRFADDFLSSVNKQPHDHQETQRARANDKGYKEKRRSSKSSKGSGVEKPKGNNQSNEELGVIDKPKHQIPQKSSKAPRYASDSSIEEWLQGASSAESPAVQDEQAEPMKFWSEQRRDGRRDRDFAAAHTPNSDGHDSFVLRPTDEEAPPLPPTERTFRHPLSTPSPRQFPSDVLAVQTNVSMTSSLGDDDVNNSPDDDDEDTFVREYGFNPDGKPVMPSPSPPAGIKYSQYFSLERQEPGISESQPLIAGDGLHGSSYSTKMPKKPGISESQPLIAGDGLHGSSYSTKMPKKQHVRRSSLKKSRKWGVNRPSDNTGES